MAVQHEKLLFQTWSTVTFHVKLYSLLFALLIKTLDIDTQFLI